MKTKISLVLGLIGLTTATSYAQVAINNSASNPNASAILDLNTGNAGVNKGFLAPQVVLTNVATAAPVTAPATGLMVYSTSAPTGGDGAGYYYWTGTAWANMNATVWGSGTVNFVARWTPNGTTLGSGLIQDNGFNVSINTPLSGTYMLSVSGAGTSGGYFTDGTDYSILGDVALGVGLYANSPGVGGYFADTYGDAAYLADENYPDAAGYFTSGSFTNLATVGDDLDGYGVKGVGSTDGVYGTTSNVGGYGVAGTNTYATIGQGMGIYGEGSGASGIILGQTTYPGIYGEGERLGVEGVADSGSSATLNVWPVYGTNDGGLHYAALAYWSGTTDYKVIGSGIVSTVVKDNSNTPRIMNCPEAPEVLFEDYGAGTLSNGRTHIDLDPTYAKNVTINDKHSLRVLITLNGECNGVYVANRTTTGFDVVELNHGTSNASFTYEVIANRADAYDDNGKLVSKNADNRFVESHASLKDNKSTAHTTVKKQTVSGQPKLGQPGYRPNTQNSK